MNDPRDNPREPTSKQDCYETTIRGYLIELDLGDPKSRQCHISRGRYGATLACLSDTGVLTDRLDRELKLAPHTVADIEAWAYRNGY